MNKNEDVKIPKISRKELASYNVMGLDPGRTDIYVATLYTKPSYFPSFISESKEKKELPIMNLKRKRKKERKYHLK